MKFLATWKKSYDKPKQVLKRNITLLAKVHLVKVMVFPVIRYGCESWSIKSTKHQRSEAFELWCWRRLLRVPWTAGRSNQSILKEINTEFSLVLKLQYFGHLMWKANSLEKTLMLEETEGKSRRGWQGMRWLDGLIDLMDRSLSKLREILKDRKPDVLQFMRLQRVGHDLVTEQ